MDAQQRRPMGRREILRMYPADKPGHFYLYAFGNDAGNTKLGMTRFPRKRFSQHWHTDTRGRVWMHLFTPIADKRMTYRIEAKAVALAALVSKRHGMRGEMFSGLSRKTALECVRAAMWEVLHEPA